jgi:hypothetical protein
MKNNNKPKHLVFLKIIGILGIVAAAIGVVLVTTGFGVSGESFMIGSILVCFGLGVGSSCLMIGFRPELTKFGTKTAKYIQKENQEDFTDIASTTADITSGAITTVAKSIKKGLKDTIFCKHCGQEIDADSKFCSKCGDEQ